MIDLHHHFWWHKRHSYSLAAGGRRKFARDYTPDDLRPELERCGIDGTVLIQVLHEVETEEFLDICRDVGFVRGVVGWLPLADPDATGKAIERLRGRGGKLVGVRHLISNEPDPKWLVQDSVVEFVEAVGSVRARLRRHPDQRRATGIGADRRRATARIEDRHEPSRPAADPGSRLGAVGDADRARRRVPQHRDEALDRPRHHHALEMVDRRRAALLRSRARPVRLAPYDGGEQLAGDPAGRELYEECWNGITALVSQLSANEQREILGATAERVYGL